MEIEIAELLLLALGCQLGASIRKLDDDSTQLGSKLDSFCAAQFALHQVNSRAARLGCRVKYLGFAGESGTPDGRAKFHPLVPETALAGDGIGEKYAELPKLARIRGTLWSRRGSSDRTVGPLRWGGRH
jgi:hypothetical protein